MGLFPGQLRKFPFCQGTPTTMSGLVLENFWANKAACDDAERAYYEKLSGCKGPQVGGKKLGLSEQIDQARQLIKNSLECVDGLVSASGSSEDMALVKKLNALEVENKQLKKVTDDLKALVLSLEARVGQLEGGKPAAKAAPAPAKAAPAPAEEEDDDVDLFGSSDEEESEEKKRITEERLKAYHEKKSKKPALMDKMLECAKTIEKEGLVWGAHKLVPVGYGIKKLQLMCVVEDEKVSIDELCEQIQEFEDYVQSVDISSMSKI